MCVLCNPINNTKSLPQTILVICLSLAYFDLLALNVWLLSELIGLLYDGASCVYLGLGR